MIQYDGKIFHSLSNSANGEVNGDTVFQYSQNGNIVTATYFGGSIKSGYLIALANEYGVLDMRYQHINNNDEIKTGTCISTPEILPNGKLRLHEKWQWTCDDCTSGESVIEER